MIIGKLPSVWYENDKGQKFIPDFTVDYPGDVPKGFIYQHSKFSDLHFELKKITQQDDVDNCSHNKSNIVPTYGWIVGIEGRKCNICNGSQTKNVTDSWPEKWNAHGSISVMVGNNGYHGPLVIAMVNPYLKQWLKALKRNKLKLPKKYNLHDAIRIAADSCERCLNVLLYRYGIDDGYLEQSDEWYRAGTSCDFCEHMPMEKPEPDTPENRMKNLLK